MSTSSLIYPRLPHSLESRAPLPARQSWWQTLRRNRNSSPLRLRAKVAFPKKFMIAMHFFAADGNLGGVNRAADGAETMQVVLWGTSFASATGS